MWVDLDMRWENEEAEEKRESCVPLISSKAHSIYELYGAVQQLEKSNTNVLKSAKTIYRNESDMVGSLNRFSLGQGNI